MLHGACVGERAEAQNLVFFPCKVALKGTLCAQRVRLPAALVSSSNRFSLGVLQCVRSSTRFLHLWLQIVLEWLHDSCHLVVPCVDTCRFAT